VAALFNLDVGHDGCLAYTNNITRTLPRSLRGHSTTNTLPWWTPKSMITHSLAASQH